MTAREPLDLDGILTDIAGHTAELPVDVVDCVGCHIAVTDVPALVAEVRALRAEVERLARVRKLANDYVDQVPPLFRPPGLSEHGQGYVEGMRAMARAVLDVLDGDGA